MAVLLAADARDFRSSGGEEARKPRRLSPVGVFPGGLSYRPHRFLDVCTVRFGEKLLALSCAARIGPSDFP